MASSSVARRYALALMSLGVEDSRFEAYGDELGRLLLAFDESPELRDLWLNPANDRERRLAAVEALTGPLGLSPVVLNLVRLLVERQRIGALPDIVRAYRGLVNEKVGRVQAVVVSAEPLTSDLQAQLQQVLAGLTRKQILLETRVDPALIGGVVAQVGGTVFDGSLKTQLDLMRSELRNTRV